MCGESIFFREQGCARPVFACWDWDWDLVYPVSIFDTETETFEIGIKFWDWDWDFLKLVSKIETDTETFVFGLKNWDWDWDHHQSQTLRLILRLLILKRNNNFTSLAGSAHSKVQVELDWQLNWRCLSCRGNGGHSTLHLCVVTSLKGHRIILGGRDTTQKN